MGLWALASWTTAPDSSSLICKMRMLYFIVWKKVCSVSQEPITCSNWEIVAQSSEKNWRPNSGSNTDFQDDLSQQTCLFWASVFPSVKRVVMGIFNLLTITHLSTCCCTHAKLSFLPLAPFCWASTRMAKRLSDTYRMHSLIHRIIGRYFSMDILWGAFTWSINTLTLLD